VLVEAFIDYSSPFAYLGSTQIERVALAHGGEVVFRPFLLGALFKAIGTPLVPIESFPPAKERYYRLELERWSARWGVPFVFSTRFPLRTVDALRLTLLAPEAQRADLVQAIMRATWAEDRDPADRAVLEAACTEAGIEHGLLDRLADAKHLLFEATEDARARGVLGAPTFIVHTPSGPELFWGQDRLGLVADALGGTIAPQLPVDR
jgi:2-hydroxychromene-2-carboxylate isomerase